jgi:hypothetical protein
MAEIIVGQARAFIKAPTPPTGLNEDWFLWFEQTNPAINPNLGIWRTKVSGSWVSLYDKDRWKVAELTVANNNDTIFTIPDNIINPTLSQLHILQYGLFAHDVDYTISANSNILTFVPLHFALEAGDVIRFKYQY